MADAGAGRRPLLGRSRPTAWGGLSLVALVGVLAAVSGWIAGVPALGALLDPVHGAATLARTDDAGATVSLKGLDAPVTVVTDARGVPHVFAGSDRDAVRALGYLVARDRLFQMDFVARVGAGRLAALLGPDAVDTDRFLRSTGMLSGARRNLARIEAEGGIERDMLAWYADGVNAYVATLGPADLPIEYRLTGTAPEPWSPIKSLLLLQYMAYDLSFSTDDPDYSEIRSRLGAVADSLFPRVQPYTVPIVGGAGAASGSTNETEIKSGAAQALRGGQIALAGTIGEGFARDSGKGSNNWAVTGARSASGAPLLAGDMHLTVSLPAIWYEVHLSTPTMNVYGVTIPGAPLPVEAMNDRLAWAFTNTGSDQIDHYRLALDASGRRYRVDGRWHDLTLTPDTIRVKGGADVLDTLVESRFGPVTRGDDGSAVAIRWTAHQPSRTLKALWGMLHAANRAEFDAATRDWDTPMQNILVATVDGDVSIRSTGLLPIRASGDGAGLRDGTTTRDDWTGRVPFDQLPHATGEATGWLASTNQMPAGASYPHYLGHDWPETYRARRIADLLSTARGLTADDMRRFQGDVRAGQWADLAPLVDTLRGLTAPAAALRDRMRGWDGETDTASVHAAALWDLVAALRALAFDEPVFSGEGDPKPSDGQLFGLLRDAPRLSVWDRVATPRRETAADLLRAALAAAADSAAARPANRPWGERHRIRFNHLTRAAPLAALGRGPYPVAGFRQTLAPGGSLTTTHAASWRVVVDFAGGRVTGQGVYPGGQSGNPASPHYDDFVPAYRALRLFPLPRPRTPDGLAGARATFVPARAR